MASAFEKALEGRITKYIKKKGGWVTKIHGNEFVKGLPDLIGCYRGRFIAFEVKGAEGTTSALQKVIIRLINKSGGVALSVRSMELVKDAIEGIEREVIRGHDDDPPGG